MAMRDAVGALSSADREVHIINFLRGLAGRKEERKDASVTEIWEAMRELYGETITRPAYYKVLEAMEAAGKIEKVTQHGTARYAVVETMHATNRVTLDDVYEMLGTFERTTDVMARAVEAQRYLLQHRDTVLAKAAEALAREPAVDLFLRWIDHQVHVLRKNLEAFRHIEEGGPLEGKAPLADVSLDRRLQNQVKALRDLVYRYLSLPREAIDIPHWDGIHGLKLQGDIIYTREAVREHLRRRVFGVGAQEAVLGFVELQANEIAEAKQDLLVAGSDGSFHAGTLQIGSAQRYIEDESFVVTFNNSVAYVRSSERLTRVRGAKKFIHSAPFRQDKLDDPTYKGMVMAPFMFPDLSAAEYEHMTRTATDVVQMRVDDEVTSGTARDLVTGELIRQPRVHIRDGTVTPQSRGYNQYTASNAYGEIVREGILRSKNILERIAATNDPPYIYAGAVKTTQIKLFSRLLNWYISIGSKDSNGGRALDADWEIGHADFVSDVDAMTLLLSALPKPKGKHGFWVSCVVVRQFASLAEFFDTKLGSQSWFEVLNHRRERQLASFEMTPSYAFMSYDATLSDRQLKSDPYLYMLEHADYASFYVGHTAGDPPPKIPRYEFMCSLRENGAFGDPNHARQYVQDVVREIATALQICGFTPDKDHNYLSRLSLVKSVISVIYRAHELAKHLGAKLESEFRSSVVAKLAQYKNLPPDEVDVTPISLKRYIERFIRARGKLGGPDDTEEEVR